MVEEASNNLIHHIKLVKGRYSNKNLVNQINHQID